MSFPVLNDENCDPIAFLSTIHSSQKNYNSSLRGSRPSTSLAPTLRRGNLHSKTITPLKVRPNYKISRPSTGRSLARPTCIATSSGYGRSPPKLRPATTGSAHPHNTKLPSLQQTRSKYRPSSNIQLSSPHGISGLTAERKTRETTVVVIGDSKCGKTTIVLKYLGKPPKKENEEGVNLFETHEIPIYIRNYDTTLDMKIWDFPGDEMFDRLRPKFYVSAKFVLICFNFNVGDYELSLNNIKDRWLPEVETYCDSDVVKIIVGIDRKKAQKKLTNNKPPLPSFSAFYHYSKRLNCKYLECSLDDLHSIEMIFHKIASLKIGKDTKELAMNQNKNCNNSRFPARNNDILYLEGDSKQISAGELRFGQSRQRKTSYNRKRHACTIA